MLHRTNVASDDPLFFHSFFPADDADKRESNRDLAAYRNVSRNLRLIGRGYFCSSAASSGVIS